MTNIDKLARWEGSGHMVSAKYLVLAAGLVCLGFKGALLAQGQEQKPAFGDARGAFSVAQSDRGKMLYTSNCTSCHGPDANGGQFGPALKGMEFTAKWGDQPATALFDYIRTNMPPGQAGTLGNAAYNALTAYVLAVNGVAPGTTELAVGPAAAPSTTPDTRPPETIRRSGFAGPDRNQDAIYDRETARKKARLDTMRPVTQSMLELPPEGDWLMWRRAYDGLGFSPLKQINTKNAAGLGLAWSWTLRPSVNEITPLVHDGVLFVHSGAGVQALDATSGELLWQYVRDLPDNLNGGRSGRSKGMAIYEGAIYLPMVDGHLIALDAKTGKLLWDHMVLTPEEIARGVQLNGVPIVAKGKVMMGITLSITVKGGCYIFALDAKTGEEKWRFNTVAQPGEVGGDSWNGVPANQRFGGSQWTGGSYDPELGLVYFGVGNTYNTATLLRPNEQPGPKNAGLFTESTVALDPESGRLAWYYQHMTRDVWDMDWVFERSLVDMPVNGKMRKLVVTGGKMALFDVLDRTNGQYIQSRDLGLQNIVTGIDPRTGVKSYNPALNPVSGEKKLICPGSSGFRNWMSTAYNPQTHILYVPIFENCGNFVWTKRDDAATAEGGIDQSFQTRLMPETDGNLGRMQAVDLQSGKTVWMKRQRTPISSSMLVTAGGLLFNGSGDRYFRAYDQQDGRLLWETRLASTASSSPITYSVKGEQFVAVVTGGGNPQDSGWSALAPEIDNPSGSTILWIFKLQGTSSRP